jgi:hypothetical protein
MVNLCSLNAADAAEEQAMFEGHSSQSIVQITFLPTVRNFARTANPGKCCIQFITLRFPLSIQSKKTMKAVGSSERR